MTKTTPFFVGCGLLLLILLLIVLIPSPTAQQYEIFRIVIALAGAAFAVAFTGFLDVQFAIFKNGVVKAGAGFAVFIILYFFSPAGVIVDDGRTNAASKWDVFSNPDSVVGQARDATIIDIFALSTPGEDILRVAENPTEIVLKSAREYIGTRIENDHFRDSFQKTLEYLLGVVNCVNSGECHRTTTCGLFFSDLEAFRWNYCEQIITVQELGGGKEWETLKKFSQSTCKPEFMNYWIEFSTPEEISNICVPTQCWALNTKPPYPCDTNQQFSSSIGIPLSQ